MNIVSRRGRRWENENCRKEKVKTSLLLFLLPLVAIIAAAFLMNSSPWRYCRRCGRWWNLKTNKQYNYCPDEADGIVKCRECEQCDKHA